MSKTDFQELDCGGHLEFQTDMILLARSRSCPVAVELKLTKDLGRDMNIDFQHGGHLGFLIHSVLAISCLLGAPSFVIKFQLNWIIIFRGDVFSIFSLYKCIGPILIHGETNVNTGPSFYHFW